MAIDNLIASDVTNRKNQLKEDAAMSYLSFYKDLITN